MHLGREEKKNMRCLNLKVLISEETRDGGGAAKRGGSGTKRTAAAFQVFVGAVVG